MDQINEYKVFQDHGKAQYDPKSRKVSNAPNGYQKIRVHLIFAVKHDGRHKARLVAGGHLTPDPIESIYSGVVSIRSLGLVIFLAKLNNLEVWGADIGNAYLEAKTKEKLYVVAGPEFEELEGHAMTHTILDHDSQKRIYRSAVRPKKSSTPNHRNAPHGGEVSASSDPAEDTNSSGSPLGSPGGYSPEQKTPTFFIRSRDEENPSGSKPIPTFDPSDLIGRTFLLPPEENGERNRAKVTRQVVEIIDQDNGQRVENINFILHIGNGKVEEIISYNQLLNI